MEVMLHEESRYFCDDCGNEIFEGEAASFSVEISYGGEDPCYGCWDGEQELMKELGNRKVVYLYLSQSNFDLCTDCRDNNPDSYVSIFEDAFRKNRVAVLKKLVKENILPEFADDLELKKERLAYWVTRRAEIIKEIKEGLSDFGYENKAQELTEAVKKVQEYR